MSIGQIFLKKTWLSGQDLQLKNNSFSDKVYKDVKVNKARWTSPLTKKALDASELLWDNNTVKTHHVNWWKKKLGFLDKIFGKKQFYLFLINFLRMPRQIKQGEHRQRPKKL